MSQFQPIFQLQIKHGYFNGGCPKGLHILPSGQTEALLMKRALALRMEESGLTAFVNGKVSDVMAYWQKAYSMDALDFELNTSDWAFSLYTEQPLDWVGTRMYDSGLSDDTGLMRETLGPLSTPPVMGKIRIALKELVSGARTYSIDFPARATQWQYYIINRSALSMKDPGIHRAGRAMVQAQGSHLHFTGPEKVVTESGEAALFFSSGSDMIALSRWSDTRFDLVDGHSASIIQKGLPLPDPAWTRKVQINGQTKACSPMYVYV